MFPGRNTLARHEQTHSHHPRDFAAAAAAYLATESGKNTVINIILCIFFWVPGILHALDLVLK